jgi:hypothetical protein
MTNEHIKKSFKKIDTFSTLMVESKLVTESQKKVRENCLSKMTLDFKVEA